MKYPTVVRSSQHGTVASFGTQRTKSELASHPKIQYCLLAEFTWTGFDYVGEVGLGCHAFVDEKDTFLGAFPWIAAWYCDPPSGNE